MCWRLRGKVRHGYFMVGMEEAPKTPQVQLGKWLALKNMEDGQAMCLDTELNFGVKGSNRLKMKVELNNYLQLCFIDNFHWTADWRCVIEYYFKM